jgi:hypothetical protein
VSLHVEFVLLDQVVHGVLARLVLDPCLLIEDTFLLVLRAFLGLLFLSEGHLLLDVEVAHQGARFDLVLELVGQVMALLEDLLDHVLDGVLAVLKELPKQAV